MKAPSENVCGLAYGMAGALLIAGTIALIFAQPAAATPKFAAETGKGCGECHERPSGGGKLTPFGEKFKANGNKLP